MGPLVPVHRHRARRSLPHLLSARRASGRPGLGAQRQNVRRGDGLGRSRQFLSVSRTTRADPNTAADGVYRDEQLCAPSRQSRRSEGHRSCGKLGAQACLFGRNAVGREARKAIPALGRGGVRRLRHERSRLDGRGKFRARRHSYLDGYVFHRSRRCRDRSLVAGGRSRHTLCHAALDQSRDAVSALEFRRSGQLRVALGRQRPFRGAFSGDPACQPHHRIFQSARRQRQSRGIRRHDVSAMRTCSIFKPSWKPSPRPTWKTCAC
jgi:hypothetical protein